MTACKIKPACTGLAVILAFGIAAMPAWAANPIFPVGSRIGLAPPAGMTVSKRFPGFEDPHHHAAILLGALPARAYAELKKTNAAEVLKKEGMTVEKRQSLQLNIGKGILVIGTQVAADKKRYRKWLLVVSTRDLTAVVDVQVPERSELYPDSVVRAALATLSERGKVPQAELLGLLPFTIGNLAGYHIANVIPGRALMLIDEPKFPHMTATKGVPEFTLDARVMIAVMPGSPRNDADKSNFARLAFGTIDGIKDIQVTMSEPVRLDNQDGFETVAKAKDSRSGADLVVVQWLRFEGGRFVQMVGLSRADIWPDELPRLRTLRDSIELK
jgi:hypothetical protein